MACATIESAFARSSGRTRRRHLGHSNVEHGALGTNEINLVEKIGSARKQPQALVKAHLQRGAEDQQAGLVDLHPAPRDLLDDRTVLVEHLAEHDLAGVGDPVSEGVSAQDQSLLRGRTRT